MANEVEPPQPHLRPAMQSQGETQVAKVLPREQALPLRPDVTRYVSRLRDYCKQAEIYMDAVDSELSSVRSHNRKLEQESELNIERRTHTQDWFGSHYGKLEDWARKVLPEPWRTQFFNCVANGTYDHSLDVGKPYVCNAGCTIVPTNYFRMDTAEGQLIRDQTNRAELAELHVADLEAKLTAALIPTD
jgi:hypothetical protein